MITVEILIPLLKNYFSVDTESEILSELKNMINEYDYSDTLEKYQDIIDLLNLSFSIWELSWYWTIAYWY